MKHWYAIYTRFRSEKFVETQLKKKGILAYVPVINIVRYYTRKKKKVSLPLISCYVFVNIDDEQRKTVLETEHVHGFIRFNNEAAKIPAEEINLMQRIVGEHIIRKAEAGSYECGEKVEIIGGNLTGLRGCVIEKNGKTEFVVELEHIGYSLYMTVDARNLHRIPVAIAG